MLVVVMVADDPAETEEADEMMNLVNSTKVRS